LDSIFASSEELTDFGLVTMSIKKGRSSDTVSQKKQDNVVPEYATGFRLSAIMGTIFLGTLLAALDIVSLSSNPHELE
jgi:hypothetical protein